MYAYLNHEFFNGRTVRMNHYTQLHEFVSFLTNVSARLFQLEAYLTKEGASVGSIIMQVRHDSYGYMILAMLQSTKKIIRLNTLIVSTDEGKMTSVEVRFIIIKRLNITI